MLNENIEESFDQPKDRSELGKAYILPREQQNKLRWERYCMNRSTMADSMYNAGEPKTWEEVMQSKGGGGHHERGDEH